MCNLALLNLTLSEKDYPDMHETACMRGLETENEVEWTVYEISFYGKNLNLEDIIESTFDDRVSK